MIIMENRVQLQTSLQDSSWFSLFWTLKIFQNMNVTIKACFIGSIIKYCQILVQTIHAQAFESTILYSWPCIGCFCIWCISCIPLYSDQLLPWWAAVQDQGLAELSPRSFYDARNTVNNGMQNFGILPQVWYTGIQGYLSKFPHITNDIFMRKQDWKSNLQATAKDSKNFLNANLVK